MVGCTLTTAAQKRTLLLALRACADCNKCFCSPPPFFAQVLLVVTAVAAALFLFLVLRAAGQTDLAQYDPYAVRVPLSLRGRGVWEATDATAAGDAVPVRRRPRR